MPLALMHCKKGKLLPEMIEKLSAMLPHFIAGALHVEENPAGHLEPRHIEVRVSESSPYDRNISDLAVTVFAHFYPERSRNLDKRRDQILSDIRAFLADFDRNIDGDVWILLQEGSFGKF